MAISKSKKTEQLADLVEMFKRAKTVVLVSNPNLNFEEQTILRRKVRENGGDLSIVKNTIVSLAFSQVFGGEKLDLFGSTLVATDLADEMKVLKIFGTDKIKGEKASFKAGYFNGKVLSATEIEQISKLPSRTELFGKMAGVINQVVSGVVQMVNAPICSLAVVTKEASGKLAN
ncbi:MAG: hypothetical protein Fur0024_1100 [Patescibacteria group bacterium]